MKRAALFFFLFLPYLAYNQVVTNYFAEQKNHAQIHFDASFATKGVTYSFAQKFYFGGTLSNADKDLIFKKLNEKNYVNFDQHFNFSWRWTVGTRGQLGFALSQRSFMDAMFSKTLFRTIFYGNNITGETAEQLGNQNLKLLTYSNLALTYRTKSLPLPDNAFCFVDLAAGIRLGHKNTNLVANKLTLQTANLAETLRLTSDLLLQNAATQFINGYGFNVDVGVHFQGTLRNGEWTASVFTQDFGLIFWNRDSYNFDQPLDYTFDGLEVQNLLHGADHLIDDFVDTLAATFLQSTDNQRVMTFSPTTIAAQAQCLFDVSEQLRAGFAVEARAAFFSNFCYRLTAAPAISRAFDGSGGARHQFSFQLPLSYHHFYGFGAGARFGFSGSFTTTKRATAAGYSVQFELSEVGISNAAGAGAISFLIDF